MADKKEDKKPSKPKKNLLPIIMAVLNILGVGSGVALVYFGTMGKPAPVVTQDMLNKELVEFREGLRGTPVVFTLNTFDTNLDGVPRKLVRVDMSLEMLDEEGFEEVMGLGVKIRDGVIKILNNKKFHEVESVQGKLMLKNDIIAGVNGFLNTGVIKNVYFTNFVVQ